MIFNDSYLIQGKSSLSNFYKVFSLLDLETCIPKTLSKEKKIRVSIVQQKFSKFIFLVPPFIKTKGIVIE